MRKLQRLRAGGEHPINEKVRKKATKAQAAALTKARETRAAKKLAAMDGADTPLNERQKRFAEEYIKDLNAVQAYKRAGYTGVGKNAQASACTLLVHPGVRKLIQENMHERSVRTGISADYVLQTIQDTVERCKQAVPVRRKVDGEWKDIGIYQFDANSVLKGCELLGKHLKLFTEKHEVSGPDGGPIEFAAAKDAVREKLLRD
jgi:phage terminase small subunit